MAVLLRGSRPGERPFDFGGHGGERRPQLVRRVGREPALAVERLVQAIEGAVQRVRDVLELVVGAIDGDARGQIAAGHRRRCTIDAADRRKRPADEEPTAGNRHQQGSGAADRRRAGKPAHGGTRVGQIPADEHQRVIGARYRELAATFTRPDSDARRQRDCEGDRGAIDQNAACVPERVVDGGGRKRRVCRLVLERQVEIELAAAGRAQRLDE
jgi:hypothetical protein